MKIYPSYQLSVLGEDGFAEKMSAISQQLDAYRQEGTFAGDGGKELYYEYFQTQESRGAIVVVHGLSEFTAKYHEFAWYMLNQGYDVFLYDQRGHGRSCRLTPDQEVIHVDAFTDYRKDLHCFICNVVRKVTQGPLFLYAHSMGGAVAIQYLAQHPEVFAKAVLSAPMIEPLIGNIPAIVARLGLAAKLLVANGKDRFWRTEEFDPNYPFERSHDKSRARFQRNMDIRLANACYRTTPLSLRWVQQSVMLRPQLTDKHFLSKIRTPILMLCADGDTVVCADAQVEFAKRCPVCRQVILPNTTHGMLCGTQETITIHLQQVLAHFC